MKIVFMGTPQFAIPSLDALFKSEHKVVAVVTGEDKPRGRGQDVSFTPIKNVALEYGIECLQPTSLKNQDFIAKLKLYDADVFVIVAFKILPKEVYSIPKFGSINAHTSLLPKYRGAAPINRAIMNGESETGITTFFLQDSVDTGEIILQQKVEIPRNIDAGLLHDLLASKAGVTILDSLSLIEKFGDKLKLLKQNPDEVTTAPKIFKNDCKISWNQNFEKLYNYIRGLSPRPTAWTINDNIFYKIFRIADNKIPFESQKNIPGTIKSENGKLFAASNECWCEILEIQKEGKNRMSAAEFLRGNTFSEGEIFS